MAKKNHGRVLTAGLDSSGEYFSSATLQHAVEELKGKVPITMGFDPTKVVGQCHLEWDSVAKSIVMRPDGLTDSGFLENLEPAASGKIIKKEDRDGVSHILEFEMTSVGLFPPGKKIETIEPEK